MTKKPPELRSCLSPSVANSATTLFKFVDDNGVNTILVIALAMIHPLQLEGLAGSTTYVVLLLLAIFLVAPLA